MTRNNAFKYAYGDLEVCVPKKKHTCTVILCHGLTGAGAMGNEEWRMAKQQICSDPILQHAKFIFPTAPERPVTYKGGAKYFAWFDGAPPAPGSNRLKPDWWDMEGFRDSVSYIESLMRAEIKAGIPANRIVLGGFSMGGQITYLCLKWLGISLAGAIAISTILPLSDQFPLLSDANQGINIFIAHGTADSIIDAKWGESSRSLMTGAGARVTWTEYPGMDHALSNAAVQDIVTFLEKVLN